MHSPIGDLSVAEEDGVIVSLDWGWGAAQSATPVLRAAIDQLDAFFDGTLTQFDLPLGPAPSSFGERTRAAMCAIPYGHTRSYGELAQDLGSSARAVGRACGANVIPIIVPCHRVLAAGGGMGGYSGDGGLETKAALLRLEGALLGL